MEVLIAGFDNDICFALNADFSQSNNQNVLEANGLVTDGRMWIGSTALNAGSTHINVGTLTSPDSSITVGYVSPNITLQVAGGITVGKTITGNTGGALPPASGNWNIVGGVNFTTAGAASTLTGRSDILTYLQPGAYPYTALDTNYYISVDTSAARTINLPNAPTTGKSYVIKDRVGTASTNNITVTTVGGAVLIDGVTSRTIQSNYGSINVVFNGTSYEIY
jgi:hypothetical protein